MTAKARSIGVSRDALDALLPLYLQVDGNGDIVGAGRTLKKLLGNGDVIGQPFKDHLRLIKPRHLTGFQQVSDLAGQRLVFETAAAGSAVLQAMVVKLDAPATWLFNFSLGSNLSDVVETFNLRSKDFSPVDSTIDLMQVAAMQADLLSTSRDLTTRLEVSRQDAERRALTDELTGLPNRRALRQHLTTLCDTEGSTLVSLNVLHVDLDNFKNINDRYGHAVGDQVLIKAAEVIKATLRPEDFVARTGGDEFVVALCDEMNIEDVRMIARRIVARLSEPFDVKGNICHIGASVGLSTCSDPDRDDIEQIIIDADRALYEAKNAGRGQLKTFDHRMRSRYDRINALGKEMIDAIEADQFVPFFQPKVSIKSGLIWGVEALARWNHPKLGTLSAGHFLSAAQQANLLARLDEIIMRKAFLALSAWQAEGVWIPHVSINVTAARLGDPGFVELLLTAAAQAGILPTRVGLEVLETVLIEDTSEQLITNIKKMSELGFIIELDDFGTGHASISNLRRVPVDVVKIDRSLVSGIDTDVGLCRITGSIVELLNNLNIQSLAEGVETAAELAALKALNCSIVQGYHIARPMSLTEITAWAQQHPSCERDIVRPAEPVLHGPKSVSPRLEAATDRRQIRLVRE